MKNAMGKVMIRVMLGLTMLISQSCGKSRMATVTCGQIEYKNRYNVEWHKERKIDYHRFHRKLMKQIHQQQSKLKT